MSRFFVGMYEHTIDKKGRTSIPSKFRQSLDCTEEGGIVFFFPFSHCIGVYPESLLLQISERYNESEFVSENSVSKLRDIAHRYEEIRFDRQGRISIPERYRNLINFESTLLFVGCFKIFEIWDQHKWKITAENNGGSRENGIESLKSR